MKMQFLLAGIVAAGLFALTPDAAAHGGGGGSWGGHGGGGWGGHAWAGHNWGGHGWNGHGWDGHRFEGHRFAHGRFFGPGLGFYGYGYPWWWDWGWGYAYYPYPYYGYDAYYGNSDYGDPNYAYRDPGSSPTKWIQTALARRGYYRGPIDGEIGRETRDAIRSFQAHQGLPVTGQADARLVRALQS